MDFIFLNISLRKTYYFIFILWLIESNVRQQQVMATAYMPCVECHSPNSKSTCTSGNLSIRSGPMWSRDLPNVPILYILLGCRKAWTLQMPGLPAEQSKDMFLKVDRRVPGPQGYWRCMLHMQNSCAATIKFIWSELTLKATALTRLLLMGVRGPGCNLLAYFFNKTFFIILYSITV